MKGNLSEAGEVEERVNPKMIKESVKFCTKPLFTSILLRTCSCITSIFIVQSYHALKTDTVVTTVCVSVRKKGKVKWHIGLKVVVSVWGRVW